MTIFRVSLNKLVVLAGTVAIASLITIHVWSYIDGLRFEQTVMPSMVLSFVWLSFALLFVAVSLALLVRQVVRRAWSRWLVVPVAMSALYAVLLYAPLPLFSDGLAAALKKTASAHELTAFAEAVKSMGLKYENASNERLRIDYPALLAISASSPLVRDWGVGIVTVDYGHQTEQRWGYAVIEGDDCPYGLVQAQQCEQVYPHVWAYIGAW